MSDDIELFDATPAPAAASPPPQASQAKAADDDFELFGDEPSGTSESVFFDDDGDGEPAKAAAPAMSMKERVSLHLELFAVDEIGRASCRERV